MYLNFEDLPVNSTQVIEDVVAAIRGICGPLGRKVYAVVNYDGFDLGSDLEDAYLDAVQDIDDTYFHGVTRFTTSAFMRAKLGSALESRGVAPHIYESEDEAAGAVRATLPRASARSRPVTCATWPATSPAATGSCWIST